VYAGSQCFDVAGVVEGVRDTLRIVREIETSVGLTCNTVNLGGGFGVSHNESRELEISALAAGLVPSLRAFRDSSKVERKIIFELGAF